MRVCSSCKQPSVSRLMFPGSVGSLVASVASHFSLKDGVRSYISCAALETAGGPWVLGLACLILGAALRAGLTACCLGVVVLSRKDGPSFEHGARRREPRPRARSHSRRDLRGRSRLPPPASSSSQSERSSDGESDWRDREQRSQHLVGSVSRRTHLPRETAAAVDFRIGPPRRRRAVAGLSEGPSPLRGPQLHR